VRILVLTLDVDLVVIGGGITAVGAVLTEGVTAVFDSWSEASPFIGSLELAGRVKFVPHGTPVAALGAARLGAHVLSAHPQEVA